LPWHYGGGGDSDWVWALIAGIAAVVLGVVGWHAGRALGRRLRRGPSTPSPAAPPNVPPTADLILSPADVLAKAERTERLLQFLARQDRLLDPGWLRPWITATFHEVQRCWAARDYAPLAGVLTPDLRAGHEELLRAMRANYEINRIEGLKVERLEFVHLFCPREAESQELTALLTFAAAVYFVNDRTGRYVRGNVRPTLFQEYWVFRRHGDGWLLRQIEPSHDWGRLEAANHVEELSEQQLRNAQHAITL
jgi:predicted lipid-binding transport protein (Tim44 family)